MSKKSRRRKRQGRDRNQVREFSRAFSAMPEIVSAMGRTLVAMSKAVAPMIDAAITYRDRGLLMLVAGQTAFGGSVNDAISRSDALPILVFADWCEENEWATAGALARRVAAKMTGEWPNSAIQDRAGTTA